MERSRALAVVLNERLNLLRGKYEIIGDVRGMGSMMGIEIVNDRKTKDPAPEKTAQLVESAWRQGLIILSCGSYSNIVRLLMPLTISTQELDDGFDLLDNAFKGLMG